MNSLDYNISILEEIEKDYGSLDNFVTSDNSNNIAMKLGKEGKYKLKQIGYTLALEYLRNVGISAIKPDLHIRRILSNARLNLCDHYLSEEEAVDLLSKLSKEIGLNLTYVDNLIWLFCAVDYGNICNIKPQCNICHLKELCNYKQCDSLINNNKTLNRYSSLLTYIAYFSDEDNIFYEIQQGKGKDGQIKLGYVKYSDEVSRFIKEVYSSNFIFQQDYTEWKRKEYCSVTEINDLIKKSDIGTLRKILTFYIRGDRFSDGMIADCIQNKILLNILLRIKKLGESTN